MYSLFKDTVTVNRLSETNGKSSFEVAGTYKGLMKPVSPNNSLMTVESIGKMYHFTTQYGADIRPTDRIDYNGIVYKVQGVSTDLKARSLQFTRVHLIKTNEAVPPPPPTLTFVTRGIVAGILLDGDATDSSDNNIVGTASNVTWGNLTEYNRQYGIFNGTNSGTLHTIPSGLFTGGEIEVSGWVYPNILGEYMVFVKDGVIANRERYLQLQDTRIAVSVFTTSNNVSLAFSDFNVIQPNEWQHIGFSRDALGAIKIYLNGYEIDVVQVITSSGTMIDSGQTYNIGYRPFISEPQYFNGGIYNNLIYNTILTQEERNQNYLFGLS